MQSLPASPERGGFSSATNPSTETGQSNTFTNGADAVRVRESDSTAENIKPAASAADLPTVDSMQSLDDSTPLPNGNAASGHDAFATPMPKREEYYFSNDDITLLHEIVATGEAILATLPERERLPTEALHRAADEVLPRHGIESEEDVPQISQLLFLIGGMRGPQSLLDKFKTVLSEKGIELVFTDDGLPSDESVELPSADVTGEVGDDGLPTPRPWPTQQDVQSPLRSTPPPTRRRRSMSPSPVSSAVQQRRNSDTNAVSRGAPAMRPLNGNDELEARHARSQSAADLIPDAHKKEVRFSDIVDSQSISDITWEQDATGASTIENLPFRPKSTNGSAQPNQGFHEGDGGRPSTRSENRPPPDFSSLGRRPQAPGPLPRDPLEEDEVLSDEEFSSVNLDLLGDEEYAADEEPSLPRYPEQREEGQYTRDTDPSDSHQHLRHNEYCTPLPSRGVEYDENDDQLKMADGQTRYVDSREQMFKMSSFNHWLQVARYSRSYGIRAEVGAELRDSWEVKDEAFAIWKDLADMMHDEQDEGFQAYQAQIRLRETLDRSKEGDGDFEMSSPAQPLVSEGSVHPVVRQSIEQRRGSSEKAPHSTSDTRDHERQTRHKPSPIERSPTEQVPQRPDRVARDPRSRLQSSSRELDQVLIPESPGDEEYYDATEEPEVDDMEQRENVAGAAWNYFLISKAFSHWANRADEEVERTQIARRHIMRKRCFNAWIGESEKDETAAESKAVWFHQMVALTQWRDTAIATSDKNRLLRRLAAHKERCDVTEDAFTTWHEASKMRLAETIDTQRLQTACFQHWHDENQWLQSAHDEAAGIHQGTMLGRYMRHWQAEARVQERAEQGAGPIIARRDEFLRSGLSLAWRQETDEFKGRQKTATLYDLGGLAKHWVFEARLRAWQEEQDAELLDSATYHWYCEWRLILVQRVLEQQQKARFFEKWADAAAATSARSYHLRHVAREFRHHSSITGFFNSSLDALEQLEMQAYHARRIVVRRSVPVLARQWHAQTEHVRRLEDWSRLGRLFTVGEDVLPHWQEVRRQEWKKRMHRLYSDFRYKVRKDTIKDCLDGWRQRAAENITKGWEADDMRVEDDNALVVDVAGSWLSKLEDATFFQQLSSEADKESHLILWHSLLETYTEDGLDAAEYDYAQTAGQFWDEWTLMSVTLRGREHAVQEFLGHILRRRQRNYFAGWAAAAANTSTAGDRVPEMMDFRATRRSSRWITPAPARSRTVVDYTPFRTPARPTFRMSTTTPAYRPPSEMTFEEVGEEGEEGEEEGEEVED